MSMEKNGAISNDTPCCGGGSCSSKQASDLPGQLLMSFPTDDVTADALEADITKQAVDAVKQSSKPVTAD